MTNLTSIRARALTLPSPVTATTTGTTGSSEWFLAPLIIAAVITLIGNLVGKAYVDGRLKRLGDQAIASFTAKAARDLEELRAAIASQKAERDAERSHASEARRRAYLELEPLFFQLRSSAHEAHVSMQELLRHDKQIQPRASEEAALDWGYRILSPQAVRACIDRRLTYRDLILESEFLSTYEAARQLREVMAPSPDNLITTQDSNDRRPSSDFEFLPQLSRGDIDRAIHELTITTQESGRCITFGEYQARLHTQGSQLRSALLPFTLLYEKAERGSPGRDATEAFMVAYDRLLLTIASR